jgi:hypothetical protein
MATEYNDYIEKRRLRKRRYMILGAILAVVVIVIVIVVPVVVTKQKKNNAIQLDTGGSASSDNTTYPINTGSGQYPVSNYAHLITPIATQNDLKERIFVIGDVHGCATEFNALLDAVHFNASTDQVILAGDLTSKGPDSIGVIRRAKEIGALCVRGNHDDKIVRLKTFELKRGLGAMTPLDATMPEGNVPDPLKFKNYHMEIVK